MTYKTTTINNISPDSSNNITLNINNVESNINSNPSTNQVLQYKDNNWANETVTSSISSDMYYSFWANTTYSTSTSYNYEVGDWFVWRGQGGYGEKIVRTSGISTTSANSSNNGILTNTKWAQSITITDAGTYRLTASVPNKNNADSGYLVLRWHDGTNYFGPKATVSERYKLNNILLAVKTINSSTTFSIRVVEKSGICYLGDTAESKVTSINVIKLD